MTKFIKKTVAVGLAALMAAGSTSVTALANSDLVNSDASENSDVGNITSGDSSTDYNSQPEGVDGYDDSQDKASEYKSVDGTEDSSSEVNIYATQEESAEVIVPKTIILDGTNTTAAGYKVKVAGNIAGDSKVIVEPQSNESVVYNAGAAYDGDADAYFYMGSKGKQDVAAEVNQTKDTFLWNDLKDLAANEFSETTGTVESNISAGMWHGNFNFNVELKAVEMISVDLSTANDGSVIGSYNPSSKSITINGNGTLNDTFLMIFLLGWDDPATLDVNNPTQEMIDFMESHTDANTGEISGFDREVESLTINSGVDLLDSESPIGIPSLKNVNINSSNGFVPIKYFENCDTLENVTLGNNITTIKGDAFKNCTNLTLVSGGSNVTYIGSSAFYSCSSLERADDLLRNAGCINDWAFCGCSNLESTIKINQNPVGNNAFDGCASVTTVYLPSNISRIDADAFRDLAEGSTIYCETQAVADTLTDRYTAANTTVVVDASRFA